MKPVVVAVGLFVMLAVHVTADIDMDDYLNMVDKCRSKTRLPVEILKDLKPDQVPQIHVAQCFMGCMHHELGIVFPNNTINVEQMKLMKADVKERRPDYYQKLIKVTEICATKVTANADDCAAAKILIKCFVDEKEKIGLKRPAH